MVTKQKFVVLCFALVAMIALFGTAGAQTRSVVWQRWDVTIDQIDTAQNRFTVTEAQTIDFTGTFAFGTRDIALDNLDDLSDIAVTVGNRRLTAGCNEAVATFCVTNSGGERHIRYFFPAPVTDATRNVTITYRVSGALRIYEGGDQLWWQAVPQDRPYPVLHSTVTVVLPPDFAPRAGVDPIVTEGASGTISGEGSTVSARNSSTIPANQKFTLRIQYPHDPLAHAPSWQVSFDSQRFFQEKVIPIARVVLFGLGLLLLIGGPLYAFSISRPPASNNVVVPTFISDPPPDIHPALAGVLIDGKPSLRHILSTLFDLARRGQVKIEDQRIAGTSIFTFIETDQPTAVTAPTSYESSVLGAVFKDGGSRTLNSMEKNFYTNLHYLNRQLEAERDSFGLTEPKRANLAQSFNNLGRRGLTFGVFILFAAIAGSSTVRELAGDFFPNVVLFGFAILVNGFVLQQLARRVSPLTPKGVEVMAKVAAFRRFLSDREKFREAGYTGENFEKYLPYTIAFGLDKTLLESFKSAPDVSSPTWYVSVFPPTTTDPTYTNGEQSTGTLSGIPASGGVNLDLPSLNLDSLSTNIGAGLDAFSASMTNLLNDAARAMTSAPPPPPPQITERSSSSSSWDSGSSGWDSSSSSSSDSGGSWSGGGDSGGGDSGGGGADFG